jgi:predicted ATPase
VIGRLADRSMLSVETAEDGTARYRLLDSIRAFAGDRLTTAGQVDDAGAAHAAWFAQAAERCAATVRGRAQPDCLALVRAERANIDSALAWAAALGDQPGAARLLEEADGLHAQVRHTLDDADRFDARVAREAPLRR